MVGCKLDYLKKWTADFFFFFVCQHSSKYRKLVIVCLLEV